MLHCELANPQTPSRPPPLINHFLTRVKSRKGGGAQAHEARNTLQVEERKLAST